MSILVPLQKLVGSYLVHPRLVEFLGKLSAIGIVGKSFLDRITIGGQNNSSGPVKRRSMTIESVLGGDCTQ